jgi:DNA polymerase/3'-5' exonuclease PolX
MQIDGLGPKTIICFGMSVRLHSLEQLENTITSGSLEGIKALARRRSKRFGRGIRRIQSAHGKGRKRGRSASAGGDYGGLVAAEGLLAGAREIAGLARVEVAGSLRRRRKRLRTST